MSKKVRVAVIGLGFGADFLPIYLNHPDAVHVVTPVDTHAPVVIDSLNAEKHVACTVPMGKSAEIMDHKSAIDGGKKIYLPDFWNL